MSGFFGIVALDGGEIDIGLLQRVAKILRFRGPDAENIWTQSGAGTCFALFEAGPGRQARQQPFTLGNNWLIGDLRIDARRELVERLTVSGNNPSEYATSEELVLRAWQAWGEASLQRLCGDFSFALWDESRRSLWCARDFVGPRPLYYAQGQSFFCFSNSLEALRGVPGFCADLDEEFVGEFLLHGVCSDRERTVYSSIRKLPAGHVLQHSGQAASVRAFLKLPIEEPLRFKQPEEYLEAYREVLCQAVQDRLPPGPAALYLSGGLDSGSVCATASRLASPCGQLEKLKAFTVGWRPLFDDPEPQFAAFSAKYLGLAHQILEEQQIEPFAKPVESPHNTPEPNSEAFFALSQKHYHKIAAHSRVILSGDGGDDVLIGQAWPYFAQLWGSGEWGELARALGGFIWEHGTLPPLRIGMRAKMRRLSGSDGKWEGYPSWLNPDFEARCGLREKWLARRPISGKEHPLHPDAYTSLHSGYWSSVLETEDAGNTQVLLETRAPLLDLRVLRFLLRVPPVPWCMDKELTRRSMQGHLPTEVLNRRKTPMARDPLEVCLATGKWTPKLPNRSPALMHRFFDWERWSATLKSKPGFTVGANLYPLVLVEWVKDVENGRGIE